MKCQKDGCGNNSDPMVQVFVPKSDESCGVPTGSFTVTPEIWCLDCVKETLGVSDENHSHSIY